MAHPHIVWCSCCRYSWSAIDLLHFDWHNEGPRSWAEKLIGPRRNTSWKCCSLASVDVISSRVKLLLCGSIVPRVVSFTCFYYDVSYFSRNNILCWMLRFLFCKYLCHVIIDHLEVESFAHLLISWTIYRSETFSLVLKLQLTPRSSFSAVWHLLHNEIGTARWKK